MLHFPSPNLSKYTYLTVIFAYLFNVKIFFYLFGNFNVIKRMDKARIQIKIRIKDEGF